MLSHNAGSLLLQKHLVNENEEFWLSRFVISCSKLLHFLLYVHADSQTGRDDDENYGMECPRLDQFEISNWHTYRCDQYLCNNHPGYAVPIVSTGNLLNDGPGMPTVFTVACCLFVYSVLAYVWRRYFDNVAIWK